MRCGLEICGASAFHFNDHRKGQACASVSELLAQAARARLSS